MRVVPGLAPPPSIIFPLERIKRTNDPSKPTIYGSNSCHKRLCICSSYSGASVRLQESAEDSDSSCHQQAFASVYSPLHVGWFQRRKVHRSGLVCHFGYSSSGRLPPSNGHWSAHFVGRLAQSEQAWNFQRWHRSRTKSGGKGIDKSRTTQYQRSTRQIGNVSG